MTTWALVVGLLAGSGVAACSASAEEDSGDEGALVGEFDRSTLFSGNWSNWYCRKMEQGAPQCGDKNVKPPKSVIGFLTSVADIFTTAGHRTRINGLLKLSATRDWLVEKNLIDTNPGGKAELINAQLIACNEYDKTNRRIDGTCNDIADPAQGAAHVRFSRNVDIKATNPDTANLLVPSPREVSLKLLSRPRGQDSKPVVQEVPFLNLLALTWIQFMNHDWFSHGTADKTAELRDADLITVPLADGDPFRAAGQNALYFRKTETAAPQVSGNSPSFYNENTHWWDGSQIYGSSKATSDALRAKGQDGKLKAELAMDAQNMLPADATGQEQSGFIRNWWAGISLMHTTFAREHNQIVQLLRQKHPDMTEDQLFDKARMINAAVMAKIHTVEWTPAILPNPTLNLAMYSNWYGLKTTIGAEVKQEFLTALSLNDHEGRPTDSKTVTFLDGMARAFHLENGPLNGLVGSTRNLGPNNVGFSLSEEFTSVYRLHSLLPETIQVRSAAGTKLVPVADTRLEKASAVLHADGINNYYISFGMQKPGQLILHNFPAFLQDLTIPGFNHYDVGAADILRDRERGVPRYNKFRELIQLKPLKSIDEITSDENVRRDLKAVYGDGPDAINKVDLLVGTLSEGYRPEFYGFGETQFQIFVLMASRRLMGDRFYSTDFNEKTYTAEGIKWIEAASMKSVISRNFPEIANQMAPVENAFLPWDGSAAKVPVFSTTHGKAVPIKYPADIEDDGDK